ncbi:hypothetical protein TSAR_004724 [Trichomalopsis sarcophagae]|uniref:Uncharacterized protein n=1 Tax=Trichomalopsis sarcophagae TaxID=543379 RepID=A0A232FL20_9HYME|nr:hypothetical protein TSAR_004724 [Trichomalopsis sarcophagae]
MKPSNKRIRVTKESTIDDISKSCAGIAGTIGAIGKAHNCLLKTNKVIIKHLLSLEEEKKKLNYSQIGQSSQEADDGSSDKSAEETAASLATQ